MAAITKINFPNLLFSNSERERNQWNFATVVLQKFASLDFRCARVSHRFVWILGPYPRLFSHVSGFKIQIRFWRIGSCPRERSSECFAVRVRATPWNRVRRCCYINSTGSWCLCRFLPRAHISWTVERRKLALPHSPSTIVVATKICPPSRISARIDISCEFVRLHSHLSWSSKPEYLLFYSYIFFIFNNKFFFKYYFFLFIFFEFLFHLWIIIAAIIFFLSFICVYTSYNFRNLSLHTLTYWLNRFMLYSVNRIYFRLPVFWLVYRLLSRHFLCTANYFVNPSTIPSVGRMRSRIST